VIDALGASAGTEVMAALEVISKMSMPGYAPKKHAVLGRHWLCAMENEKEPTGSASERPGLATGAFVAAMLTASLISVFYLAWKAAGLPFVPI